MRVKEFIRRLKALEQASIRAKNPEFQEMWLNKAQDLILTVKLTTEERRDDTIH